MKRITIAASGPSLTLADCMNASRLGPLLAVNCAAFMAPFADAIYAGDETWWKVYAPFLGWSSIPRYTVATNGTKHGVSVVPRGKIGEGISGNNSGVQAITLALLWRYDEIVLIGFDCGWPARGREHFHGAHHERLADGTPGCANPRQADAWLADHARIADNCGQRIINASRQTALTCYRRATLEGIANGRADRHSDQRT